MIAPNTIVGGRYRVVKALGGGGMKLVYLAEDLRLAARACALAEMVDSFTSPDMQQQAVAAFQREADMLAQLANEHIPRIFDRFSESNHHYLVMEYIDGETVEDELRRNSGRLAPDRVIDVAIQVLETLEYLHNLEPPVIYRDLKPSNIMITKAGQAKLIDFGIARHFAPLSKATMIGTQGYAPPEQYRGRVETRSDLYALGAAMHQALSGRDPAAEPPFSFPPLRKLCPDLDAALTGVVDQALAYDVANRIRNASEFKRRLIEMKAAAASFTPTSAAPGDGSGRPQLNLPLDVANQTPVAAQTGAGAQSAGSSRGLGGATPQQTPAVPPSTSAPTILSVNGDIRCSGCARAIPADSRFCSYCAADLRHLLSPFKFGHDPEAETSVLSPTNERARAAKRRERRGAPHAADAGLRRRRRLRRPALVIAAIFALSFAIARMIEHLSVPADYSGSGSGAAEPPASVPPETGSAGSGAPAGTSERLAALRQALDDAGYSNVKVRMNGDTIELWGTVPSEFDRATVQWIVFRNTGIFSLRDHMRVTENLAEP